MSAQNFDRLTKGLALEVSRRGMLKTLGVFAGATIAAAGVVSAVAPRPADAGVGNCPPSCPTGQVCCLPKNGGGGWGCRHPGQCK